jgi:hypothetical protein
MDNEDPIKTIEFARDVKGKGADITMIRSLNIQKS